MPRKKLLYLVHRLPYPPNKGDKISSFNILKHFSEHWDIHLGTFIDDPTDWEYVGKLNEYCKDSLVIGLGRTDRIKGIVKGLFTGEALSVCYYQKRELTAWVNRKIEEENPDGVLIYSGAMAQFVAGKVPETTPVIFDLEDVDSEKWRSYAASRKGPLAWLFRREADKLLDYERRMAAETSACVLISREEAELFQRLAPEIAARVTYRIQGVDSDFFSPGHPLENPFPDVENPIVFTGAMDYPPNIDATKWFCRNVFPSVRSSLPQAAFYIVGMNPTAEVRELSNIDGVTVTGGVPDVRPFLKHARCACLPLRIARGIQNKALEAMAMELPIVATPEAMVGIALQEDDLNHVVTDPGRMAEILVSLLTESRQNNVRARETVLEGYNWRTNLQRFEALFSEPGDSRTDG
jgi:sugar transferase (PEP-CTERM/EpsH1 system associated)